MLHALVRFASFNISKETRTTKYKLNPLATLRLMVKFRPLWHFVRFGRRGKMPETALLIRDIVTVLAVGAAIVGGPLAVVISR